MSTAKLHVSRLSKTRAYTDVCRMQMLRCLAVHIVPVQTPDLKRTRYVITYVVNYVSNHVVGKQLPAATDVLAWNRYFLMVIRVRIHNRYNNVNEEN